MQTMTEILDHAWPVLPVVVLEDVEQAVPLAAALQEGGVRVVEITLRTSAALAAIRLVRQQLPDLLVGAGTVTTTSQIRQLADAGAQFAVSPGFSLCMHQEAQRHNMPWLPGVMTPSEIMQAMELGYRELKLFPARGLRGRELLNSFAGPFAGVRFCPTGGINADNLATFLQHENVSCCGGSWLAPAALIEANNWAAITAMARQTVESFARRNNA